MNSIKEKKIILVWQKKYWLKVRQLAAASETGGKHLGPTRVEREREEWERKESKERE